MARLKYLSLPAIILLLAAFSLGYSPRAIAQTNIQDAIVTCSTCQTPAELSTAAANFADAYNEQTPPGYVGVLANWGGVQRRYFYESNRWRCLGYNCRKHDHCD